MYKCEICKKNVLPANTMTNVCNSCEDKLMNDDIEIEEEELITCEFIDLCEHKYTNGNNQVKYHCNDLKSLDDSFAYCIIRKEVYKALGNPNV